ncbi:P-loop containing nucleoside triphosphate hydrolase protein [Mycena sp. CBHHK59/15]|nr:P-loop containing nucleoside triphosphate hydrolase protein [Mycena sp. CBHHK59/15]
MSEALMLLINFNQFRCARLPRHFSQSQPVHSRSFERHASAFDKSQVAAPKALSFEDLGLHPPIVSSLQAAFPDIRRPTQAQGKLIPAVLSGQDILLQDQTGSGKSFGLVLALLNKPRVEKRKSQKATITSVFIVPHRDLAYQFHNWVRRMFQPAASASSPSISSIAQVLVRDSRGSGLSVLHENPPHLLFATPQALMDMWREEPDALQLRTLSAIVVDEADYLIETVDYSASTSRKPRRLKRKQHPGDTRAFLDIVYGNNARPVDDEYVPPERDRSPQLIVSSATLPSHLIEYVCEESSWLVRDTWVSITDDTSRSRQPRSRVSHSVLVVCDDHVRNITGAGPPAPVLDDAPSASTEVEADDPVLEFDAPLVEKYAQTASPFNPLAMETIAMVFAADVPSIALLVIPSALPIQRAVFELRQVGVNAHGLDLWKDRPVRRGAVRENPTLLVCTWANMRGLDVVGLTHVFVLGLPDDASGGATAYVHIAGRVGRLESTDRRRGGKVVTVVEEGQEEAVRRMLKWICGEASEMTIGL